MPIVSLDQKGGRVHVEAFEIDDGILFDYFNKLGASERDRSAKEEVFEFGSRKAVSRLQARCGISQGSNLATSRRLGIALSLTVPNPTPSAVRHN